MKEVEVEIIVEDLDFHRLMEDLAGELGLPLIQWGEGKTTDHYLDTKKRTLLASGASLRLREKLQSGLHNELRLTIKFPLEEHDILVIRDEIRLKLLESDWKNILSFTQYFAIALGYQTVMTHLLVDEYYQEVSLGTPEAHLDVSFDNVAYICPDDPERNSAEFVLEFEDHGIGSQTVLDAYEFVKERFGYKADRRGKYRRGIETLGL